MALSLNSSNEGSMNTVDNLIDIARDDELSLNRRKDALEILTKTYVHESNSLTFFNECFSQGSNELRRLLIGAMDKNNYPQLAEQARQLINEDDNDLRHEIIRILGRHGQEKDLDLISTHLDTHCFTVNYAARQAMDSIEKRFNKPEFDKSPLNQTTSSFPNLSSTPLDNSDSESQVISDDSCPINGCVVPPDSEREITLPINNNPSNSLNLLKFFDELSDQALQAYQAYYKLLIVLPPIELAYDDTSRRVHILETDLNEEIKHFESSLKVIQNHLDSLHETNSLIEAELRQAKREEGNFWNSLMTTLSSSRQEKLAKTIQDMEEEASANQEQITQLEEDLYRTKKENKKLLEPLIKARKKQESSEARFTRISEELGSHDKLINQLILRTLKTIEPKELSSRLSFLNDTLLCPELTTITVEQIQRLSLRLHEQKFQAQVLIKRFDKELKASKQHFSQLGKEIALSLPLKQHQKQQYTTLKAQVHFEDKSRQLKGSAEGEGRVQSSTLIEELQWIDRPELDKQIKTFSTSFHQLGISSAQNEWAAVDIINTEACLHHYLDTIRLALEADFIRYRNE